MFLLYMDFPFHTHAGSSSNSDSTSEDNEEQRDFFNPVREAPRNRPKRGPIIQLGVDIVANNHAY